MAKKFEQFIQERFSPIENKINKLTDKLFDLYLVSLNATNRTNKFWNSLNMDIKQTYAQLNKLFIEWSKIEIPFAYKASLKTMDKKIKNTKYIVHTAQKNVTDLMNGRASTQLMGVLVSDTITSMSSALFAGAKNFNRFTRLSQQKVVQEFMIDASVVKGFVEGDLRKSKSLVYKNLKDKLGDKKFLEINGRSYKPMSYSELLVRTKFHEAQSGASIVTAINYGTDLVKVSSHNTTTEICQDFEGKIYSISGTSSKFPALTESSPFHPNCLHLMFPEFAEAYTNKELEQLSDFSKGKISSPPFPAGFVPISQRKVA